MLKNCSHPSEGITADSGTQYFIVNKLWHGHNQLNLELLIFKILTTYSIQDPLKVGSILHSQSCLSLCVPLSFPPFFLVAPLNSYGKTIIHTFAHFLHSYLSHEAQPALREEPYRQVLSRHLQRKRACGWCSMFFYLRVPSGTERKACNVLLHFKKKLGNLC